MYKTLLCTCMVVLATASVVNCCDDPPPNILLIMADDLGYNDVGYHGSDIVTPHLDDLAYGGLRLENYYVQPICTPSRSQLLSGRYQIRTGLQHGVIRASDTAALPLDSPTIAEKLREAGYSTHMVGKWHLGFSRKEYTPTYRGFDSFYGFLSGSQGYYDHYSCNKGMCGYDLYNNTEPVNITSDIESMYSTHEYTQKTIDIINSHDETKPLFMYVPFQAVHGPFDALDEYMQRNENITNYTRRLFAGMVTCMDEAVKNITDAMIDKGLWNNTILIFTTDNGGKKGYGSNFPLRGSKGKLFEGGIRAVGFVHSELLSSDVTGTVSNEMIHISDWFPTLVRVAGGTLNGTKPLDGFDQWNSIKYGLPSPRNEILININPTKIAEGQPIFEDKFNTSMQAGLRMGDWKILTGKVGKAYAYETFPNTTDTKNLWLFNITADPIEQFDLSEQYPDVVASMLDRLSYYYEQAVPQQYLGKDPQANPDFNGGYWGPWLD